MIWKAFRSSALAGTFVLLCSQLVLTACTTTTPMRHAAYQKPIASGARVLLMKPDIECSVVTASGLIEPNAAWTTQCQRSVQAALPQLMAEHDAELIVYDPSKVPSAKLPRYRELSKLYEAVGVSMQTRHAFPTARSKTDWTLGKGVRVMREDHDADYALFIFLRDQYETGGRIALRLAVAALGVVTRPAMQWGFASLVDLDNGDIVWFNQLASTVGDLRELKPARDAMDSLLEGSPVL